MKYALQIYGQLRTFQNALPSLLHFIDYYNNDYDVFLFIDKGHLESYQLNTIPNYSEYNMIILFNMLIKDRIKNIRYTDDMNNNEKSKELEIKMHYEQLWAKFNNKYGNIVKNDFVCALMFRKYLLNNMRLDYENSHKIQYDYVVRSRFDWATSYTNKYTINSETTPVMLSDCLSIGKPEFINKESECALYWPITPDYLFDEECNLQIEKYKKYQDWRGDKFIEKHWLFMPELNIRLFLLENNISFIEAWWCKPCNYGFKILR